LIKSLQEASSWYSRVDGVEVNPSGLNQERISALSKALLNDFSAYASIDGQTQRRKAQERELLDEQTLLLDMVETNNHLYFDGPPGSGKTHLLLEAAKRLAASGKKTLVTCFSLLLADSLELSVGAHDLIDVHAWHPLLMKISGLSDNLDEQTTEWFEHTLPEAALTMLEKYPRIAEYAVIIVDEFQDIAANPLHRQVLQELTTSGLDQTVFVLAGDSRQQIMRPQGQRVNALSATREFLPHVVHVRIRRNCRMAPDLSSAVLSALKMPEQFITHRVPPSTDGALHIIDTTEDDAPKHLAKSVRKLLEKYRPQDIVILSMFGLKQSLAARILDQRVDQDSHAKWIAKQLAPASNSAPSGGEGPSGAIRWHSIFKFKGLDADAVIITDVNEKAIEFLGFRQLSPVDTLFVGMTRAKYECVVLDSTEGSAFTGV
jgi:DNA polymerase III delta prime subunit